jgi:hypothetical protein
MVGTYKKSTSYSDMKLLAAGGKRGRNGSGVVAAEGDEGIDIYFVLMPFWLV